MIKTDLFVKTFNAGNYKKTIELSNEYNFGRSPKRIQPSLVSRVVIGSYVFLGELKKALSLYKQTKSSLGKDDLAIVLFYLAIGQTRAGEFASAKELILECHLLYKEHPKNSFIQFGLYQALGFLSYFRSRFRKSLMYAEKATDAARDTKDISLIILAEDLYANNQIISGQIYSGIEALKKCYAKSLKARNMNLAKSIRVSVISFESQYGLLIKPIGTLKNHLKKIHPQNAYSRNLIWLALLNEYLNQGRLKDFEDHYPLAQKEIFKVAQHRHQILLRFKWAHWEFLRFHYEAALLELAKIEEALSLKNDILLLSQIYGLRYKILKERNPERADQILSQLKFWQKITGSNQSTSHLMRIKRTSTVSQSQDKIGNMINEYYQSGSPEAVRQLTRHHRWIHFHDSLDHTLIRAHQFKRVLILGFAQNRALYLTNQNWVFIEEPTTLVQKLIGRLSIEPLSKEQLVELIWGYTYDPLTHDPMLMTLIQRARKYLEQILLKITVSDGIYQLDQPLLLSDLSSRWENRVATLSPQRKFLTDGKLTFRQLQILETISNSSEPVTIGGLLKLKKMSRMTLFRDLRELHLQNKIIRLGQGRGVSYVISI